jgi:hypothetical protein
MFYILEFPEGLPMSLEEIMDSFTHEGRGVATLKSLLRQYPDQVRTLIPGVYNITPENFHRRDSDYSLQVDQNGRQAVLTVTPRYHDVVVTDVTPRSAVISKGVKTFNLPREVRFFTLVGPNDERKPVIWSITFFIPG